LEGFLIKPFQRICRYVLLLKELYKNTPKHWVDYNNIANAIEGVDSIVREANEAKRVMDNLHKILQIQALFDDIVSNYLLLIYLIIISFHQLTYIIM
jgi:hypothetical protein